MKHYWQNIVSEPQKQNYMQAIKEVNKDLNAFVYFNSLDSSQDKAHAQKPIEGTGTSLSVPFAVKSNIAIKGKPLTCASKLLENFVSPISATAVQALERNGAQLAGLTNMDEFGMGSSTVHSIFGRTNNPWDIERSPGGSSGGSAVAVSSGMVPFALGSDTGGSIRQPSMFCGVWGLKPSYGAVSRYGLVAYASSLDVIGIIAEDPDWLDLVFSIIKVNGRDPRDASSFYPADQPPETVKKIAAFIPKENITDEIRQALLLAIARYKEAGYQVEEIDLSIFDYAPAVYLNISTAEASANLARFDGIRYGNRAGMSENSNALVRLARSKGFGKEVQFRVLTGGYVLQSGFQDQYYKKSLLLRNRIRKTLLSLFTQYDLIVLPAFPTQSFLFNDTEMNEFMQKLGDTFSVVANLAGIPAAACPVMWENGLPAGVQLLGPHYSEKRICSFLQKTKHLFEHRYSPYTKTFFEKTGREAQERKAQ